MHSEARRTIRPRAYVIFFLIFGVVVFASHGAFLALPYFWDEAGQFIPAALDILRGGWFIPHSIAPNVHPPLVMAYLAGAWKTFGYSPETTRCAMLLLAALGALTAFLLSIELSREARGSPALLAAGMLCVSPLFVAQSMLAQLDAPAMLFTAWALLLFLQDRIALSAAVCVGLVLVKETGVVVPVVFALWLSKERRWRDATAFLAPAATLAFWLIALKFRTGSWAGNTEFVQYNLYYPLNPLRLLAALLRRIYYLLCADLHWVGALSICYAWRRSRLFYSRSWQIAWLLAVAHVAMFTVVGGAVLERYLVPVLPILYAGIAAALTVYSRWARIASTVALLVGLAAGNFINPPYPFPYENNLALVDFITLHRYAADLVYSRYPGARVDTMWPMTVELADPDLGYVRKAVPAIVLPELTAANLERIDWSQAGVFIAFSRTWNPRHSVLNFPRFAALWERIYGEPRELSREQVRAHVPLPLRAQFDRRGQWVDIYVNPDWRPAGPYLKAIRERRLSFRAAGLEIHAGEAEILE